MPISQHETTPRPIWLLPNRTDTRVASLHNCGSDQRSHDLSLRIHLLKFVESIRVFIGLK